MNSKDKSKLGILILARIIVFHKRKFGQARKDLDMHTNASKSKVVHDLGCGPVVAQHRL
jgi:hypothetical protein